MTCSVCLGMAGDAGVFLERCTLSLQDKLPLELSGLRAAGRSCGLKEVHGFLTRITRPLPGRPLHGGGDGRREVLKIPVVSVIVGTKTAVVLKDYHWP